MDKIKLSKKAKEFLAKNGYDKKYGARPLKRTIQKHIEDLIASEILNSMINEGDTINIDHHVPRDEEYYYLSIVNIDAPSTTYMIWKFFEYLDLNKVPLADNIAIPLYTGLLNDTGSFRYSAVNSDTHNMAAHLLMSNVVPNTIFQHVYENRTKGKINLLSS